MELVLSPATRLKCWSGRSISLRLPATLLPIIGEIERDGFVMKGGEVFEMRSSRVDAGMRSGN